MCVPVSFYLFLFFSHPPLSPNFSLFPSLPHFLRSLSMEGGAAGQMGVVFVYQVKQQRSNFESTLQMRAREGNL